MYSRQKSLRSLLDDSVFNLLKDAERQMATLSIEQTRLENQIDDAEQKMLGKSPDDIIKKRRHRDDLIGLDAKISRDIDDLEAQLIKDRKTIEQYSAEINRAMGTAASQWSKYVSAYSVLADAFGSSINTLRERLKIDVEKRATDAFLEMTARKSYKGLKINSNYGLTIIDEKGETLPLRSAGAEQIVALSLIDALGRSGRSAGPVVMDTPFGRLDERHRQNILQYLPKHARQLVLLVQPTELGPDTNIGPIKARIGKQYQLREISSRHTEIEAYKND
jgi:DNA sulfur modification protein DndD